MWPKVDEEMKKRLENVSDERWGERKDGGKKIQCNICLEVYGMEKFHPFPGCAHRPYCSECVGRSIREDLHGKGFFFFIYLLFIIYYLLLLLLLLFYVQS